MDLHFHLHLQPQPPTSTSIPRPGPDTYELKFDSNVIQTSPEVILLGIEIDDKLNFKTHIHQLVKRAGGQLNFLIRNRKYLNFDAKKVVIDSFILANLNYCPLVWHFCSSESMKKIDKLIEENIAKYVKTLSPKTIHFVGGVTQDFGETTF